MRRSVISRSGDIARLQEAVDAAGNHAHLGGKPHDENVCS